MSPEQLALRVFLPEKASGKPFLVTFPGGARVVLNVPADHADVGRSVFVTYDAPTLHGQLFDREIVECQRLRYRIALETSPNGSQDACEDLLHRLTQYDLLNVILRTLQLQGCPAMHVDLAEEELSRDGWANVLLMKSFREYSSKLQAVARLSRDKTETCLRVAFKLVAHLMPDDERRSLELRVRGYFSPPQGRGVTDRMVSKAQGLYHLCALGYPIQETAGALTRRKLGGARATPPPEVAQVFRDEGCAELRLDAMVVAGVDEESVVGEEVQVPGPDGEVSFMVPRTMSRTGDIYVFFAVEKITAENMPYVFHRYVYTMAQEAREGRRGRAPWQKCARMAGEALRMMATLAQSQVKKRPRPP